MQEPSVKSDTMTFGDLIGDIERGVLKIPAFQREFRWDFQRTLGLLDSISKSYPIGSFLLWDTDEIFGAMRNIGNIELPDVPDGKEVSYVLDGQQRITSLYAAAVGAELGGESYQVFADLDAEPGRGDIFARECPDKRRYVSLADLLGDSAHDITPRLNRKRHQRFNAIREAFRGYRFPVVRVRNQPVDAVCEMFERVNTGGMTLDLFDIMVAKTWTPKFNLRDKWDAAAKVFRDAHFEFGGRLMLQALAANLRSAIGERDILSIRREEIVDTWGHVFACLRMTVDYLRAAPDILLSGSRLLSYPGILVVIAHFFDTNGRSNPTPAQSKRIAHYYWRVGFDGRYGADAGTRMERDMRLMEAIARNEPDEVAFDHPVLADEVLATVLKPSWAFPAAILASLAVQGPVDITNGIKVHLSNTNLARANSRHYHHIFPKRWLVRQGHTEDEANCIANIMFVPAQANQRIQAQAPSKYMATCAAAAGDDWRRWLRSHLIYAPAERALMEEDYATFIEERAKTIADHANKLAGVAAKTK
jgi:hypothetical protein